jgi:hypothetical protein
MRLYLEILLTKKGEIMTIREAKNILNRAGFQVIRENLDDASTADGTKMSTKELFNDIRYTIERNIHDERIVTNLLSRIHYWGQRISQESGKQDKTGNYFSD